MLCLAGKIFTVNSRNMEYIDTVIHQPFVTSASDIVGEIAISVEDQKARKAGGLSWLN